MSSGQQAWQDELAEEAYKDRVSKLEAKGIPWLLYIVERLDDKVRSLEQTEPSLSRAGWIYLDHIKALLKELS